MNESLKKIEHIKSELLSYSFPNYLLEQYMLVKHYEWFEEKVIE